MHEPQECYIRIDNVSNYFAYAETLSKFAAEIHEQYCVLQDISRSKIFSSDTHRQTKFPLVTIAAQRRETLGALEINSRLEDNVAEREVHVIW